MSGPAVGSAGVVDHLGAALDEAENELDTIAAVGGPAVVRLAKVRRPIAAIGLVSAVLDIEAESVMDGLYVWMHDCALSANDLLAAVVGEQMVRRHSINDLIEQLTPASFDAVGDGYTIDRDTAGEVFDRIAGIISKIEAVLVSIVDDEAALPDLREAAREVLDELQIAPPPANN